MKLIKTYMAGIITLIAAILLDQFTKYLAAVYLKDQSPFILLDGIFELTYLENRGAAFGMMQGRQFFFLIMTIFLLGFLFFCYRRIAGQRHYFPIELCIIFVVAGAIGNMIDRIRLGYVVDFFYFSLIDFPVFNVADIYVTVAAFLGFILLMFYYKEEDFLIFSWKRKI